MSHQSSGCAGWVSFMLSTPISEQISKKIHPRLVEFMQQAIKVYCDRLENKA